jgi:hypothetical protein
LARLHEVKVPAKAISTFERPPIVPGHAPDFVRRVTARMMEGLGDLIPVSAMPVDGTFPSGTAVGESGTSPRRCLSGARICASSAGSAASSARTA